MTQVRAVPENRIKMLQMYEAAPVGMPAQAVREKILRSMGMEIALKLFQFQKVREVTYEDGQTYYLAKLEVIVPEGAPEMPKIAGDPLRKVTLNLYDADVQWFQDWYGQGYSEQIREIVRRYVRNAKLGPDFMEARNEQRDR